MCYTTCTLHNTVQSKPRIVTKSSYFTVYALELATNMLCCEGYTTTVQGTCVRKFSLHIAVTILLPMSWY